MGIEHHFQQYINHFIAVCIFFGGGKYLVNISIYKLITW